MAKISIAPILRETASDVGSPCATAKWVRLLAYVTGLVNRRLLLQNEYLIAENRILRSHLPTRLRLSDPERSTLAEIGKRLGRQGLQLVASVALPDCRSRKSQLP